MKYRIDTPTKAVISEASVTLTLLSKLFSIDGGGLVKGITFNGDEVYAMHETLTHLATKVSEVEFNAEVIDAIDEQ